MAPQDRDPDPETEYLERLETDANMRGLRLRATRFLSETWADKMNQEYGPLPQENQYAPSDMLHDPGVGNRAPMASDLVQFVLWLASDPTPDNMMHGELDDQEVRDLAKKALEYTGE